MQLYWTLKSIPELSGLSLGEGGRVWRSAYWKTYRHWQAWLALAGFGLCVFVANILGGLIGYPTLGGLLGVGVGGFVCGQVIVRLARPYLRDSLSQMQPH
jgi:hypothetical protein